MDLFRGKDWIQPFVFILFPVVVALVLFLRNLLVSEGVLGEAGLLTAHLLSNLFDQIII